jgi:hypothetical protein
MESISNAVSNTNSITASWDTNWNTASNTTSNTGSFLPLGVALTENLDKAFTTSGSKCLDFFTRIVRAAPVSDFCTSFNEAWQEDKETAFKILMNLRDVRDGKGEKLIPVVILVYLKFGLPDTVYEAVLRKMLTYGYWKDLLTIMEITNRYKLLVNKRSRLDAECIEVKLFAEQLKQDLAILAGDQQDENQNESGKQLAISLCGKWAPTENTHYDHHPISAAKNIAKLMGMTMKEYRLALSKLRAHLNILERLMSTQQYDLIDFSKLPSIAMMKLKKSFNRDTNAEGKESDARVKLHKSYEEYLAKLTKGETKINVTGIQPHELVKTYHKTSSDVDAQVEAQWKTIVERVLKSGAFNKVTAVCDVSGSMEGEPMLVSISLGILVSECTQGPFVGKVLTFDDDPQWHSLTGSTLKEKVNSLGNAKWGGSTNMRAVFDLILKEAVASELPADQMVETLFIFTDMQFNSACGCDGHSWGSRNNTQTWESTFEYAQKTYTEAGYKLPNIVCWNLRTSSSKTMPVSQNEKGYAMLSGFSAELLKCILDAKEFTPMSIMKHVLEPYVVPNEVTTCTTTDLSNYINLTHLADSVTKSTIKKAFIGSKNENTKTDIKEDLSFSSDSSSD